MKRSVAVLVLLALGGSATSVLAQGIGELESYTVTEARALKPDCSASGFDDRRIAEFEQAVCLFHKTGRNDADTGVALDALREAQTKGLPPVHQNFAALLSGLMNCQQAQAHLDRYKASENKNLMERTRFCRDRRVAAADLGDIHWDGAHFDYEPSSKPGFSLNDRLSEMGACQATVLDPSYDAECGLISNISDAEINTFVDGAVDEVIAKYFSGVESPITAMFARKVQRAEGLKKSAAAGITELRGSAADVDAQYGALNTAYLAQRDSKMAKAYTDYRDAILRANTILDEFNRWKDGLFITAENVNLLPKIKERSGEIDGELTRVQQLGFEDKATGLVAAVSKVIDSKAETTKLIAQLCRIYFCELANRRSLETTIRACRRPGLANNPLCITPSEAMLSGTITVDFEGSKSIDVKSLCQAAGLDPDFTTIGLGAQLAASCLAAMP